MINPTKINILTKLKDKGFSEEIIKSSIKLYDDTIKDTPRDDQWDVFYVVFQSVKKHHYKTPTITELLQMFQIKHTDIPQIMNKYNSKNNFSIKENSSIIKEKLLSKGYSNDVIEETIQIYEDYYKKINNLNPQCVLIISLYRTLIKNKSKTEIIEELSQNFNVTKFYVLKAIKDAEKGQIECISPKKVPKF